LTETLYGAKVLSLYRKRGWRLPEIIVDDTYKNILPSNQTRCVFVRPPWANGHLFLRIIGISRGTTTAIPEETSLINPLGDI
jgi:hypothetical protein